MWKTRSALLAGTILTGIAVFVPSQGWSQTGGPVILAQQAAPAPAPAPGEEGRKEPQRPGAKEPAKRPAAQEKRDEKQRPAAQGQPGQPQRAQERRGQPQVPAAQTPPGAPKRPTAQERPGQQQPPAAQTAPGAPKRPTAQERPGQPPRPSAQERPSQPQPPAVQTVPGAPQRPTTQERPAQPQPPAAQTQPAPGTPQRPSAQERPAQPQPPAAQTQPAPGTPQQPSTAQDRPGQLPRPSAQERPGQPQPPAAQTQPAPGAQQPATAQQRPGAIEPSRGQVRDSREFMRRDAGQPAPTIDQVRQERREVREGDRVFIREPGRVIIREGNRTIIRHNEVDRFAVAARNVHVERRGNETISVVERPNGVRIVTVTDEDGRLIRRMRRDPSGREIIIIDNSFAPPPGDRFGPAFVIDLPPPIVRMPRERYIVEADRASPRDVYEVLTAPPIERIDRRYTLDQVRYSHPLRERMPRLDLDVTFDLGSWQIAPDQVQRLAVIADGMQRAIDRNPREVFMIEGHTDAVGGDDDNLSLSDRRAETVAVALTETFQVPPENLVTQGYGEQYLKIPTQEAERQNRRVTVRRVTPLIDQEAQSSGRGQ